jgi:hypothetical protein
LNVSVASLQPAPAIYREEQYFAWWIYALLSSTFVIVGFLHIWGSNRRPQAVELVRAHGALEMIELGGAGVATILLVGVLRMTTLVTPTDVRIWFGLIPTYRKYIAIGAIQRVEVVDYRPIVDYGGWGIRFGRDGERVFNARGSRGVRLFLSDGSKYLIGSQNPEELAGAINETIRLRS